MKPLALVGLLALAGCVDPHSGYVDPLRTGLLGAGIGGGAGLIGGAIAQGQQYPAHGGYYAPPAPAYGGGYYRPPPVYYAPPQPYYAPSAPSYYYGGYGSGGGWRPPTFQGWR